MRKNIKVPRILKIEKVDHFNITCMFNNGESRVIDFKAVFKKWKISENDIEYPLINESEFKRVELRNQTLSWNNIKVALVNEDGVAEVHPHEIDPLTLFELSQASGDNEVSKFGSLIRRARKKSRTYPRGTCGKKWNIKILYFKN